MERFNFLPLCNFETAGSTSIKRPKQILEFSFNKKRECQIFSDEALSHYYPPFFTVPHVDNTPVDLKVGYENWERKDESVDEHLVALLQTLQANEERLLQAGTKPEDARTKADLITWRGMMTKIMTMAHDRYSEFEMNATCYEGTIFLEDNHRYSYSLRQKDDTKPTNGILPLEVLQYTGHKFETLSVLPRPWAEMTRDEIESRDQLPVDVMTQYCSIVSTGIGNTSLVLAGEVDCIHGVKPENPGDPIPWVELKTTGAFDSRKRGALAAYERKLLKFWAQSFLLGVPHIVVGFRSPDGFLIDITTLETQKIPGRVARGQREWDGNVCIKMTEAFLDLLRRLIMGTEGVWRIKRAKGVPFLEIFQVSQQGTGDILTKEFKAHRERMLAAEIAKKLGELAPANSSDVDNAALVAG